MPPSKETEGGSKTSEQNGGDSERDVTDPSESPSKKTEGGSKTSEQNGGDSERDVTDPSESPSEEILVKNGGESQDLPSQSELPSKKCMSVRCQWDFLNPSVPLPES